MFFSTARTAASRAAIARRTYATKQAGESFPEESFNSSIWRNTVIAVAAGALWLRFDNSSEDNKHLFTKWIEGLMTSSEKMDSLSNEALAQAEKLAEYRLIAQDAQRAPIYRMRYPEGFERASPRGLIAGQQADLSDLKTLHGNTRTNEFIWVDDDVMESVYIPRIGRDTSEYQTDGPHVTRTATFGNCLCASHPPLENRVIAFIE